MPEIKWRLKGKWLKNCSCDYGCPCDFNSKPTHTVCEGMVGQDIEIEFDNDNLGNANGHLILHGALQIAVPNSSQTELELELDPLLQPATMPATAIVDMNLIVRVTAVLTTAPGVLPRVTKRP